MSELRAQSGELRATIHVTRKATGKVETYELIGAATPEQAAAIMDVMKRSREHGSAGVLIAQPASVRNADPETKE